MTNKISNGLKKILVLTLSIITIFIMFSQISFAQAGNGDSDTNGESSTSQIDIISKTQTVGSASGYDTSTNRETLIHNIAGITKYILSLIGIIFLILIIISGFQWMMAGGNEEVVTKSKNRIKNAVIGLAITLLSYSISYFIFTIIKS